MTNKKTKKSVAKKLATKKTKTVVKKPEVSKNVKNDFPWWKKNPGYIYLDSSASALKPKSVIDAIVDYYERLSTNPHNNDSDFTNIAYNKMEEARSKIAKLYNAKREEIIFTSGSTESTNLVANALKPFIKRGDQILLTYGEHGSNILPWMRIAKEKKAKLVFAGKAGSNTVTEQDILDKVTKKTKVVGFVAISNYLGFELDIKKIVEGVRERNNKTFVMTDATQMLPHKPIDVRETGIDFFVCSGYKMCAATGTGLVYMKEQYLDLEPFRFGGAMNVGFTETEITFAPKYEKFEGGTPHTAGIISWGAAVDYLNKFGWDRINKNDFELKAYINQEFAKISDIIDWINPESKYPIVLFTLKGLSAKETAAYLGKKKIITRAGLGCARLSPHLTGHGPMVRASFYLYNDKTDVDKLVKALKEYKPVGA